MIIQNVDDEGSKAALHTYMFSPGTDRTANTAANAQKLAFYVSQQERKRSRSLEEISDIESLTTQSDGVADDLLLLWKIGRLQNSQVWNVENSGGNLPAFNAFCARIFPTHAASELGYLPLTPASPTKPAVLKGVMENLVKVNRALGHEWTIIAGD